MSGVPREFVFTRFPARQGMVWLAAAYVMFKTHRLAWSVLVVTYFLMLLALSLVPFIGPFTAALLKPVFAVGLLAAAWTAERGGRPAFVQLFQGFRSNLWPLLAIGVVFIVAVTLVVVLSTLIDGGRLNDFRAGYATMSDAQIIAALSDPQLQLGTAFSALLSLWVEIFAWWAVALVVFQEASAGGAMATSLRAARANWRPLALYCVGVFFYGGVVPSIMIVLVALVAPASAAQFLATVLLVPYWIFFAATLHVSFYVSYRDVFHAGETLAPLTAGG
ncbi:MAG: BPSS1780 family membrane protein [Casimicrobiaceae bacterium]